MICVISDTLKEKFLSKMVGDVLAAARSGQPFSTEGYIKDTYKQILDRTADRAKAQTFASFIPGNLISIFAANKEAGKYLTPSIAELATLRETFEDFDSVGTYLGIGQEAAQTKKQEIVEANEASLRVEEDPTAGASPAVVAGTAQPSNKSSISTNFKAAGKSALTAFNIVRPDADPIVVASENFIGKYHQAQKNGSAEYQGLKLKVVPARSIIADLPQSEREFLEDTPSYEGVKAIVVNADNTPVRIDSQGNVAEEGVLAQYMLNRPELVDGVFVRRNEPSISEVASALGVDESVAQEARQKEYRTLYNIRKALEQDPNREIYVGINTSAGFSVSMQYSNPVSLNDIDFAAFGEQFIPFVDSGTGKAFFELSFAKDPLPIDRPGITSVIPAETLAKYIFDESIPLATRKEVFESLLYTKDIKLREGQVLYKNQPVTEDVITSVLKSVTESARGSINSTYRANVPLNTATTVDIPYYDQNGKVQYNTLDAVDYLKKYFTTPARLEETTAPYFNLDITPEEQIAFQADVERLSEQITSVKQGVEISSNAKGLAAALTNPTELAKSKGNLTESYPIEFRGKTYKDAEAAYQALKSTATKDDGPNSTYNLMVNIIKAKLEQHPRLVNEITKQGGSAWILSSTHQPTKANTVWETGGKNWFIKALNDAYLSTQSTVRKTYLGRVTSLQPNQIFVFGSNPEGRHGAGAAKYAKDNFGAVYGQGEGLQGQSYALPTKDLRIKTNNSLRSISPQVITNNIKKLYEVARQNSTKEFLVSDYSESNLNGYTGQEMADMFNAAGPIPSNIVFNENFDKLVGTTQPTGLPVVEKTSVKPATSVDKAKPVGLQLDLDAITADIANKLKENIISNGLGATFNIQESVDSDITETISKGKQNSCK